MPATTIVPVAHSATPFSIMYTMACSDSPATATLYPLASLLNDMVAGPLKTCIQNVGAGALNGLNLTGVNGTRIRIYEIGASVESLAEHRVGQTHVEWTGNSDPAQAGLTVLADSGIEAEAVKYTFEVRFNHAIDDI